MLKDVKHITQQGPTCGIYAAAMIVSTLCPRLYPFRFNRQALAAEMFNLAIDAKISTIGELFTVSSMTKLLALVNQEILCRHGRSIVFAVEEFANADQLHNKLSEAAAQEQYILMAYYSKGGKPVDDNVAPNLKDTHWGAFYPLPHEVGHRKVSGKQGYSTDLRKKPLCDVSIDVLYKANSVLTGRFEWDKYFKAESGWLKKFCKWFVFHNLSIKIKIRKILKTQKESLCPETIPLDVRGKLITIGVGAD